MEAEVSVSSSSSSVSSSSSSVSSSTQTSAVQPNLAAKQRDSRKSTSTTPAFLSNLGRATLRGIRRCPQCGVYNGTRGLSCKNKACGVSLRIASAVGRSSRKCSVEVVKVIIDSEDREEKEPEGGGGGGGGGVVGGGPGGGAQVFSVCHRGRGATATQWGFVELVPTDTAIATGDGATLLTRINLGRCFMPSCRQGQRSHQGESAAAKQSSDSLCVHIKQAIECRSRATPLTLKSSVLEGLQASIQAREELWRLATESPGPLVQRVSKHTLVVKCHTDSQHPLGLLHLTVAAGGLSEGSKSDKSIFHCTCQVSRRRTRPGSGSDGAGGSASAPPPPPPSSLSSPPCLHFYACVCAFASDDQLAAEFTAFISFSSSGLWCSQATATGGRDVVSRFPNRSVRSTARSSPSSSKYGHFLLLNNKRETAEMVNMKTSDQTQTNGVQTVSSRVISPGEKQQAETSTCYHKVKKLRLDEPASASSPCGSEGASRRAGQRRGPGSGGLKVPGSAQAVDERTLTMGFHQWLSGVTERIHQTMHYQLHGKPQPLVYHIPQDFFNALQQRLSLGSKKRRLPNLTTALVRNDGLPFGSFSKYTWNITNLTQVKRIFDTPELPLEVTQSFVKNVDGSYSRFHCPDPPLEPEAPEGLRTDRPQAIRPMELRTFLKVGPGTADQNEPGPFVIEWIPDVLPRCHMGELRISFEFGHQQSGQLENQERTNPAERGGRNKSDCPQHPKLTNTMEILQVVV